ncbi:GW dipeptide domain-containing protein [Virgibacillus litoralis]|uniref:Autolysin n=1 Tax=Virgibacillus litoralis TaxID=578221 RepID=A0ABS4HI98_9BACI|nr:N-acetylmuramoyl-L-alanine amidase [Virgibacillus litoralis]MBP1950588.1 bifunctional autolysin [Virgibacillus litoralis]
MKKTVILVVALLLISFMFPLHLLAQGNTDDKSDAEVQDGTNVYGEDISELSEEELKYIPKGWRDGEFKSDHDTGETPEEKPFSIMSGYPDVNDYIRNMSVDRIDYDHNSDFTKFNYRNGYGAVEGVVSHETANEGSNIKEEINYMGRNHENAFVHAFVDDTNIIEIHPTNLAAWGAGRYANERFVHVELVQVNSFDKFAKSINNYSDYIATILYNYNLGVTNAEKDGIGTLWSHDAVREHLGGTTHVDPHGYFDKWGYKWNDYVKLVKKKYKEKVRERGPNTSKLGHVNSNNARIYSDPTNLDNYREVGSNNTNEVFYIKAEAKLNGTSYYLINREPSSNNAIGWINAKNMSVHTHSGIDSQSKSFKVHGNGKAFNKAWGGSKNLVYDLSSHSGKTFNVNLTESVGSNKWYRGTLAGKQVWIHASYLVKENGTSKLGHLSNSNVKIYEGLVDDASSKKVGTELTNAVYYIKKEARVSWKTYYLISTKPSKKNGIMGWVSADDMSTHSHVGVDSESKTFIIKGSGKAYSKAWGGSKDLVYNLSDYRNKKFNVHLTEKVGSNIWYRGNLDGRTVWMHSSYVTKIKKSNTSKLGHIHSGTTIYKDITDETSSFSSDKYLNAVYYIKQQAEINGQNYYLISKKPSKTSGVVGWINSKDMTTYSHIGVDRENKTVYIKGSGNAYSKAWGGSKDLVYDLSDYKNRKFKVHLTEKVGSNTWYRGILDGKVVWMHSSYVTSHVDNSHSNTSNTSKLGHLRYDASMYPDLDNLSSNLPVAGNFTNAVYYIKKQASVNGQTFYLISTQPSRTNGLLGWVKASDMSTHSHVGVDWKSKTFIIKGSGNAFGKAWGGSKDLVYDLSNYKNQKFNVHLTEKVGSNTWYRGNLDGKTVWMHSSFLK